MLVNSLFHYLHVRSKSLLFFLFLFASHLGSHAQGKVATGPGQSAFTAKLINIEAATNETFRYSTTIRNGSAKAALFEFKTNLPIGWMISYKVDGNQVAALSIDPGTSRDVAIEVNTTAGTAPGKYKIPVKAIANADTLSLNLEAVVKGSYGIALTTPSGKLSEELTSGGHKGILLEVKNLGTLPLNDIGLSSQLPTNWEVAFEPAKIKQVEPGKTATVTAKLKVPD